MRQRTNLLDDEGKRLAADAFALAGGRVANFGVGFFSLLIYGSIFSKPEIASINLFELVVSLFLSIGFTWSAIALVRFGEGEYSDVGSTADTSSVRLTLVLPIFVVSTGAILLFQDRLLGFIGTDEASLIAFLCLDLAVVVAREHLVHLFMAREQHRVNALIYLGMSVGKLAALLWLWSHPQNVSSALYIKLLVGVDAFALLVQAMLVDRNFLFPIRRPARSGLVSMSRFALPQIYGFAALFVINWVDAYIIRLYGSADELGGYQFVYTLFRRAATLSFILNTIFFPRIMQWNRSRPTATVRYLRKAPIAVMGTMGALVPVISLVVAPLLTRIFGPKFADFYTSLYVLLGALPWVYGFYVYVPLLNSRDRVMQVQLGNVAAAGVNLVIGLWLVPQIGVVGAALSTLLAFQMRTLIVMVVAHRLLRVPCRTLVIATIAWGSVAAGYVWMTV